MEAIGRIPPHSIEAEVSVLGAMMLDREAVVEASEVITRDDFYRDSHKILFDVMMELFEKNEPVDLVTVTDALRSKNLLEVVGGLDYVAELPMNVISTSTVPYYAKMIRDKATLRRLIDSSGRVVELGYNGGSVDEVLEEAERAIFMISESRTASGFLSLRDILPESLELIDKLQKNKGSISGVPSGYSDLDSRTSGFQPSDLVLIAARPSMGKTAFALNIAHNAAVRQKKSVAIFSLEMSKEQLTNRLICSEAAIDSQKLRMGMLEDEDWPKLTRAVGVLSQAPIYIDDTPNITIPEMRGKLRRLKMEKGLDMVIIDYLQLMQSDKKAESRQQEVSNLSRELKGLARELNVPIITLSQLSRAPEARSDHRPMLSDLRESGAIEQDADVVMFLYREDYYEPDTDRKNITEVILAKQRNGPTGTIELYWLPQYTKFVGLEKVRQE
ncbi:MAG: replicative DNA helicase [Thermoanaerobacteraceae bacterium]|nr:replicative DNA helicase [Thermoanaerobacteraceae bacterium]